MSDLLTAHEYKAIAETMAIGGNAFIDGIARPASSGEAFPTTNPATGRELAQVAACGKADVDLAVRKAREAFEDGRWRNQGCGSACNFGSIALLVMFATHRW